MELYMDLATTAPESNSTQSLGLGFLDSTKSILELELVLSPDKISAYDQATSSTAEGSALQSRKKLSSGRANKTPQRWNRKGAEEKELVLSVKLQQDLAALKGRKGDTGESVALVSS